MEKDTYKLPIESIIEIFLPIIKRQERYYQRKKLEQFRKVQFRYDLMIRLDKI